MTQLVFSSSLQVTSFLSIVASPYSATATVSLRMSLPLLVCVNCRRYCREVSSPQASFLVQCLLVLASKGDIWGALRNLDAPGAVSLMAVLSYGSQPPLFSPHASPETIQ